MLVISCYQNSVKILQALSLGCPLPEIVFFSIGIKPLIYHSGYLFKYSRAHVIAAYQT
jgi:hypothetical protein